jgi:hypothetical protein
MFVTACDDAWKHGIVPSVPSAVVLAATIDQPLTVVTPASGSCHDFTGLVLVLTASRPVNLDQVTIHLLDGSNVGGPSVTFPQPDLTSQFGSIHLAAGTTRSFGFHTHFGCSVQVPRGVTADVHFVDGDGASSMVSATRNLP